MPEQFAYAYSGLEMLVGDLSSGGASEREAGEGAARWLREDAHGSLTLAKSAILAMRHEAGIVGLGGDAGEAGATLGVLEMVDRALDPPEDAASAPKTPRPARVPDTLRERAPDVRGFRLGRVEILAEPKADGWRLSVSHPERFPYWEELMLARGVTGDVDIAFAAVIPPASASPDGRGFVVDLVQTRVRKVGGPAV